MALVCTAIGGCVLSKTSWFTWLASFNEWSPVCTVKNSRSHQNVCLLQQLKDQCLGLTVPKALRRMLLKDIIWGRHATKEAFVSNHMLLDLPSGTFRTIQQSLLLQFRSLDLFFWQTVYAVWSKANLRLLSAILCTSFIQLSGVPDMDVDSLES